MGTIREPLRSAGSPNTALYRCCTQKSIQGVLDGNNSWIGKGKHFMDFLQLWGFGFFICHEIVSSLVGTARRGDW